MKHVVIGGGPSGVIYALKVKKDYPNDKVVIIESSDKLLKRVLVSGNGRANFFNQELLDNSIDKAYDNKDAALKIIEKDYASKTLAFLRALGLIYIIDNEGRFYPYSNSSLTVWKVLIEAIKKFNIDVILNEKVVSVDESKKTVLLASLKKVKYDKLFVAVGGYSYDRIKGINKSLLDSTQKKVEGQNFDTRKNLLDYDDVLRQQREIMYKQRDTILFSDSIFDSIQKYFERAAEGLVSESIVEIDQEKVVDETKLIKLVEPKYLAPGTINPTDFHQIPADEATDFLATIMYKIYLKKRKGWSDDVANYVEKTVTLQQVDKNWTKHIDTMSKLRESIYLRSYANSNPLQAYTNEGYDLFNKMALTISDEVVNNLLHVQVRVTPQPQQPAPEAQPAADAEEVKEVRETPTEEPKQEEVKEENKEQN